MDPMITADCGFTQFLGPEFGFWLLGSSDRGSQSSHGSLITSSLFYEQSMSHSRENDVGYINISLIVILNAKTQCHARQLQQLKSLCILRII